MQLYEKVLALRERRKTLCNEIAKIDSEIADLYAANAQPELERGSLPKLIVSILQNREDGLTAREIGQLAVKRGITTQSREFTRTVYSACNRLIIKGELESTFVNSRRLFRLRPVEQTIQSESNEPGQKISPHNP